MHGSTPRGGWDDLKYDWCNTDGVDPKIACPTMRDALRAAGRPIILTNNELIALNQDTLGIQGRKIRDEGELEVWSKRLSGGASPWSATSGSRQTSGA